MYKHFEMKWCAPLTVICILALFAGCSSKSTQDYIPKSDVARSALEKALETWKSGAKNDPIEGSQPVINVFDSRWRDGEVLESFTVGEAITGQEHPMFAVKIQIRGNGEIDDRYRVIGIDPLLCFGKKTTRRRRGNDDIPRFCSRTRKAPKKQKDSG